MDFPEMTLTAGGMTAVLLVAKLAWIPVLTWTLVFAPIVVLAVFLAAVFVAGLVRWYVLG